MIVTLAVWSENARGAKMFQVLPARWSIRQAD
jgi:hypothetical protein